MAQGHIVCLQNRLVAVGSATQCLQNSSESGELSILTLYYTIQREADLFILFLFNFVWEL